MNPGLKADYTHKMKAELFQLIEDLDVGDLQKKFLKSRWLDQLMWMEAAAKKNQKYYYLFRLACIIGGVLIPALVSLRPPAGGTGLLQFVTVLLSLIVAVSAAIEEFFHFGERWRHYRRTAELLKGEGWSFFQLAGGYQQFATHADAYSLFAGRMEEAFQHELEIFISKLSKENAQEKKTKPQ